MSRVYSEPSCKLRIKRPFFLDLWSLKNYHLIVDLGGHIVQLLHLTQHDCAPHPDKSQDSETERFDAIDISTKEAKVSDSENVH